MSWVRKADLTGPIGPKGVQGVPGSPPPFAAYTLPYGPQPIASQATVRPTSSGSVTYTTPAKFGSAFRGGRLDLPSVPTLRGSGNSFTLEMWLNIATPPNDTGRRVVAAIGGDNCYLFADGATGKLGWNFPGQTPPLSPSSVCDGSWHHVALQWTESTTSSMSIDSLYIDGVASTGFPVQSTQNHDSRVTIGGLGDTAGYDNAGATDEVRLSSMKRYSGAFTPLPTEFGWDSATLDLAHLSSASVQTGAAGGYPARPATAGVGAVTYIGPTAPTDATTYDRWVKTA